MTKILTVILVTLVVLPTAARGDQQLHERQRYILHAGDVVSLNYRYTPEFNETVTIQPDGYVTLAIVGDIKIAGLTMDEMHDRIIKLAASRLTIRNLALHSR